MPPVCRPGDRVAVVSPSWPAPAHYPALHEQAMDRLRGEFGLVPVEYPTTRCQGTPQERARDLMAAFTDSEIRAVLATIGGDDQITVLPHLDASAVAVDPKPFIGYSDITNLLNWLWHTGIGAWHGGSTQVHLSGPAPDPVHLASLRTALFGGRTLITPLPASRDFGISWDDPRSLTEPAVDEPTPEGWTWVDCHEVVAGLTWGGNLEVLQWILGVGAHVREPAVYEGCILLLETSEEHPPAAEVRRMMTVLGERGLLAQVAAVVAARPVAHERADDPGVTARRAYREDQRDVILAAVARYAPGIPVVVGVEFGHTSPQYVLPYGGQLTLDPRLGALVVDNGPETAPGRLQESMPCA
jgi:muramoyltetrapeptide carboxypeptidase LdcA involved in peptidoglycan recycling